MSFHIISLGGSLVVPNEIDVNFLREFKEFIFRRVNLGDRFILIVGGGKVCRKYQEAASIISEIDNEEKDWLGIHSSRLNGHLLRTIFKKISHPKLIKDYEKDLENIENYDKPILIGAGWKPGWSTDYDAVLCAKHFDIKSVINLSNIDYIYSEDPKLNPNAKIIEKISWDDLQKIIGEDWDPGLNAPFDPIASKLANTLNLKVAILNGKKIENLENYLEGKDFVGSIIEN